MRPHSKIRSGANCRTAVFLKAEAFVEMDFGDEIDDDALMAMMDSTEAGAAAAPAAAEHDVSLGALQRTMREVFGFDTFRPGQLGCARAVLAGRDAAVFMATGSGKSLCYQLPAFHVERATVLVVSPLI